MAFPFVDEVDGLSKVIKKIIMLFFGVHRRAKFIDFSLHGLKNSLSFLQLSHFDKRSCKHWCLNSSSKGSLRANFLQWYAQQLSSSRQRTRYSVFRQHFAFIRRFLTSEHQSLLTLYSSSSSLTIRVILWKLSAPSADTLSSPCKDLRRDASLALRTRYIVARLSGWKPSSSQNTKYCANIVDLVTVRMMLGIAKRLPLSSLRVRWP